jgi:hypothetical protein
MRWSGDGTAPDIGAGEKNAIAMPSERHLGSSETFSLNRLNSRVKHRCAECADAHAFLIRGSASWIDRRTVGAIGDFQMGNDTNREGGNQNRQDASQNRQQAGGQNRQDESSQNRQQAGGQNRQDEGSQKRQDGGQNR